jgi:uncharacterized RDD family membrane protein YckC
VTSPAREVDTGPGSLAGFGPRLLAFVVDGIVLANLLAIVVDGGYAANGRHNLVIYGSFLVIELVFVSLAGQTPGMRLAGIVVLRADGGGKPSPLWALVRTLLIVPILPALLADKTGRALHDRAANTRTLRTR